MKPVSYDDRRNTILVIILAIGIIFVFRLLFIQVISPKWKNEALKVSETKRTIQPSRGLIFDRNGTLLALNTPGYELWVTPRKTNHFDTTELANLIGVSDSLFKANYQKLTKNPKTKQLISKKVPKENVHRLNAVLYRLKGFELQDNSRRDYPLGIAPHVLGYIREVDKKTIEKKPYYRPRDLIGKSGIEKYYEKILRGDRGKNQFLKDAYGNLKEVVSTDSAKAGSNLTTTLDADLQAYSELLMKNKIGSIVAIEPSTGEILTMVSSPTFNQDNLRSDSIGELFQPTFNRPLQSQYPPGSIFKMVQGLIALEMGAINVNTTIACKKDLVGCHNHPTARSLPEAIKYSCNPYFFQSLGFMAHKMEGNSIHEKSEKALTYWNKQVKSFGLGTDLKVDVPNYKKGSIPNCALYDKMYKGMNWNYRTCNSISIGQGEMLITPLQMANLACIFGNRGHYYYPHFLKPTKNQQIDSIFTQINYTGVNKDNFPLIADAMQQVVEGVGGTARLAKIEGVIVCGKTGTAQNPQGEDHSVFIAFAPKENPKIAISVYIENAGFGGTWAAPTASLIIEKYLTDTIKDKWKEKRILEADLIPKKEENN